MKRLLALLALIPALGFAQVDRVVLYATTTCSACQEAERLLDQNHIKYTLKLADRDPSAAAFLNSQGLNYVPDLFVNNKFMGSGVGAVENYIRIAK